MDEFVTSVRNAIKEKDFGCAAFILSAAVKKDGLVLLLQNRGITKTILQGIGIRSIIKNWCSDPPLQYEVEEFIQEIE